MAIAARFKLWKVLRFVADVAFDLLIPDVIEKPLKIGQNFYRNFLVVGLADRIEMFRELDNATDADELELARLIVAEWRSVLPSDCRLPGDVERLARQLVTGLREAKQAAAAGRDPGEALNRSLSRDMLQGRKLASPNLDAAQRSLGQLLMSGMLADRTRPPQTSTVGFPAVPGHELLRLLGSGGFGHVYLARNATSGEVRAVKVGPLTDPNRFRQEIAIAGSLDSPHLVRYHDHGEGNGQFWIAMEYLGETTLADLMVRPGFRDRPDLLLGIGEQLLEGLAALHARGLIHRDLKPANVMLDGEFRLKLIDFGLAKPVDRVSGYASTTTGTVIGSPFYMSPEQLKGSKTLTPASDVYSFGSVLYELFVGHPPHRADSFADIVLKAFTQEIPFDHAGIPADVRPVMERCLKRVIGERYADAGTVLNAYREPARVATRRICHEHTRDVWMPVIVRGLLERFVAERFGEMPENAVAQFQQFLRHEGLVEVDSECLAELFPPIISADKKVQLAQSALEECKRRMNAELSRLDANHLRQRADQLETLESACRLAREEVMDEVCRQLALVCLSWHDGLAEEAVSEQAQTEDHDQAKAKRNRLTRRSALYVGGAITISGLGIGGYKLFSFLRRLPAQEANLAVQTGSVKSVAFSPKGQFLAFGSNDKSIRLWNVSTRKEVAMLIGHSDPVSSLSFSPDGRLLASGSAGPLDNNSLTSTRIWELASGKEFARFEEKSCLYNPVSFSPDCRHVASGCHTKSILLWDVTNRQEVARLNGHESWVTSLSFSPDGELLVSCGFDRTIRLWDMATRKEVAQFHGHTDWIHSVIFSPNGRFLASGSGVTEKSIRLWDVVTRKEIGRLDGHMSAVGSIAYSPDGRLLASGSHDGTMRLWDLNTREELIRLYGGYDNVSICVTFRPEGRLLASGGWKNKYFRLFNVDARKEIDPIDGQVD